jgi:hypothetical protein
MNGKVFFAHWVECHLEPLLGSADPRPTPLSVFEALCVSAEAHGLTHDDLRHDLGQDVFEAMARAMVHVSRSMRADNAPDHASPASPNSAPALVMQSAVDYLDALRDVVANDMELAADLLLCHLARQGFVLRRADITPDPVCVLRASGDETEDAILEAEPGNQGVTGMDAGTLG